MKSIVVYRLSDGLISLQAAVDDDLVSFYERDGYDIIEHSTVFGATHYIDGEFVAKVDEPSPVLAEMAISKRNRLLSDSDWTQGKDVPDEVSQLWQPYRQALRDVPGQAGFPNDINWPVAP